MDPRNVLNIDRISVKHRAICYSLKSKVISLEVRHLRSFTGGWIDDASQPISQRFKYTELGTECDKQLGVGIGQLVIVTDATASVTITQVAQKLHRASLYML